MKTRTGFVSNSSSTSFIVPKECREEAIAFGLKLISIRDLKACFKKMNDLGAGFVMDYNYNIESLNKLSDNDYITQPYDRDVAFGQDISYGAFMEDL